MPFPSLKLVTWKVLDPATVLFTSQRDPIAPFKSYKNKNRRPWLCLKKLWVRRKHRAKAITSDPSQTQITVRLEPNLLFCTGIFILTAQLLKSSTLLKKLRSRRTLTQSFLVLKLLFLMRTMKILPRKEFQPLLSTPQQGRWRAGLRSTLLKRWDSPLNLQMWVLSPECKRQCSIIKCLLRTL